MTGQFRLRSPNGTEVALRRKLLIGRASTCDIVFSDRTVSRQHATVWEEYGAVYVRDMGSANGTYVNGARAEGMVRLNPGDELQIGNVRLLLEAATQAATKAQDRARPVDPVKRPASAKRNGKRSMLPIGVAILALMACGCLVVVVLSRNHITDSVQGVGSSLAGVPESSIANAGSEVDVPSLPTNPLAAQQEHPMTMVPLPPMQVAPGNEIQYNTLGVGVRVPIDALMEGEQAQVISAALPDDVTSRIAEGYEIGSLAYSVVTTGEGDGRGLADGSHDRD
jgi:pSer/pThr/pTyr-binding forkhead associated (FHA) protein